MDNIEKKKQLFEKITKKWSHLSEYCTIGANGLDDDSVYFHPRFTISEGIFISSQADVGNNNLMYALVFNVLENGVCVDIHEELIDSLIVGFHTNKEVVFLAMDTLNKVKNHVSQLNNYCTEYVTNVLIGNSLEKISESFINEIKTTNQLVSFMKKKL